MLQRSHIIRRSTPPPRSFFPRLLPRHVANLSIALFEPAVLSRRSGPPARVEVAGKAGAMGRALVSGASLVLGFSRGQDGHLGDNLMQELSCDEAATSLFASWHQSVGYSGRQAQSDDACRTVYSLVCLRRFPSVICFALVDDLVRPRVGTSPVQLSASLACEVLHGSRNTTANVACLCVGH